MLVCILTAGQGTRMGSYAQTANKALLPINKKAIISHIICKFPKEATFVIGLGYLGEQVRSYLEIAHPRTQFKWIEVENYVGHGSGPGFSLLCCKEVLQNPFFFVSCDTLWTNKIDWNSQDNWVGVAKVPEVDSERYCNFEESQDRVIDIHDKKQVRGSNFCAFIGLCYIKDYEVFWESLSKTEMVEGEHQISNGIKGLIKKTKVLPYYMDWSDVGTLEKYKEVINQNEAYDFSKTNEFLYLFDGQVIKYFKDEAIAKKRIQKAQMNPDVFPKIHSHKHGFYAYNLIPGQTLYQHNNLEIFSKFLKWLEKKLWKPYPVETKKLEGICKEFYYDKTMGRLNKYQEKYPEPDNGFEVNGTFTPPALTLLNKIPWDLLNEGVPSFIHGDLQFDNVLYTDDGEYILIDWRQEFGGYIEFGDLYYDLAKLYGGILLNYDYIKLNLLTYFEEKEKVYIDWAQRANAVSYIKILSDFIKSKGLSLRKVQLLVPLIYLNMAPLHNYPFDKMLYSMSKMMLVKELEISPD